DAPGEEVDQTIGGWAEDVRAAHQCFVERGVPAITWFAMRLAANVALRAATMARDPPAGIVVWDPVVDGRAYLDAVLASHRREAAGGKGLSWQQMLDGGLEKEPVFPGSVLGFHFGAGLVGEIE